MKSVCVVVSSPLVLKFFLTGQISALSKVYRVTCVTKCNDVEWLRARGIEAPIFDVPIEREPSPLMDLVALIKLYRFFRGNRFDVVHSLTPKGGLLAMTAAWLARTPARVHTFTGQVWATRSGVARALLKRLDSWTAARATHVLVDSQSQRTFLQTEGVAGKAEPRVLGRGSLCGVDTVRFKPDPAMRAKMRAELGIDNEAAVFLYIGRLKRDKGLLDLARAFSLLAGRRPSVHLVLAGPDEDGIAGRIRALCPEACERLAIHGYTDHPEHWMAAADVLCLPSYREGFPTSILEAASAGLPTIGSKIYGISDAVEDGVTGLLHEPGDSAGLADRMELLAADEGLRGALGAAALARAHRDYSAAELTAALLDFYSRMLAPAADRRQGAAVSDSRPAPAQGEDGICGPGVAVPLAKRVFDVLGALILLVLCSPLLLALGALVKATSPGPAIYWSSRIGRNNRVFRMPKFRSMRQDTPQVATHLLGNPEQHLTPVGSFLRRTSLDELPQLASILAGDLSFVGPRPALFNQSDLIALRSEHGVAAAVPGLTGWAQVNGRDDLPIPVKVQFDREYVRRMSLTFDLKILAMTMSQVLRGEGVRH